MVVVATTDHATADSGKNPSRFFDAAAEARGRIQGEVRDFHELMSTPAGVIRDATFFQNVKDVRVLNQTLAESIDRAAKQVRVVNVVTGEKQDLPYDTLVLATGAVPVEPRFEGTNLNRVFRLNLPDDALAIREAVDHGALERAVLIGGGLIGLETAEALVTRGLHVSIVEMLDQLLPALLDWEMAAFLEKYLRGRGVNVGLNQKVTRLEGDANGNVARVHTTAGTLEADLVLLALGVRPNVQLAREAGLVLGSTGAMAVNEHLQTSDPVIYAGGDCVECQHLVSGQKVFVPLGSTANKHGRIIGDNAPANCPATGRSSASAKSASAVTKPSACSTASGLPTSNSSTAAWPPGRIPTSRVPAEPLAAPLPGGKKSWTRSPSRGILSALKHKSV